MSAVRNMRESGEYVPSHALRRGASFVALTLAGFFAVAAPDRLSANDAAGHALAQKFAGGTSTADDRRAAEEAEMLARARQEAAEREAAQKRAAAEAERKDEDEKKAELERFVNEAEAKQREEERRARALKKAEDDRKAQAARRAEQDRAFKEALEKRLAAERAVRETADRKTKEAEARVRQAKEASERAEKEAKEREAREAAELAAKEAAEREAREAEAREAEAREAEARARQAREATERAEKEAKERQAREAAELAVKEAEEKRLKEAAEEREARAREARAAEARARYAKELQEAETRRRLEAEREESTRRITEKLKRLEERSSPDMGLGAGPRFRPDDERSLGDNSIPPGEPDDQPSARPFDDGTRVTILLVMEPGTTGIRRYGRKTADPVLCIGTTCWVSAGPEKAALEMFRGKALGPGNTLGRRAAACNQKLACVYRNVDLKKEQAQLQPIDLRILRHDRRQPLTVRADRTCDAAGERLHCTTLFHARGWRAWVVPEGLAARIGAEALEGALVTGLPMFRSASAAQGRSVFGR